MVELINVSVVRFDGPLESALGPVTWTWNSNSKLKKTKEARIIMIFIITFI